MWALEAAPGATLLSDRLLPTCPSCLSPPQGKTQKGCPSGPKIGDRNQSPVPHKDSHEAQKCCSNSPTSVSGLSVKNLDTTSMKVMSSPLKKEMLLLRGQEESAESALGFSTCFTTLSSEPSGSVLFLHGYLCFTTPEHKNEKLSLGLCIF